MASRILSESCSKRVRKRTIRVSHSHSPTNPRSCPFLWKAFVIPILRLCKIRIRIPCHFTLPKALMSPGYRTSASHPRRRGYCLLLPLHPFRLTFTACPNRRCQCTHLLVLKPSEYQRFGCLRHTFVSLLGSPSEAGHNQTLIYLLQCLCVIYTALYNPG